jgi:hypothetical protein
MLQRQLGKADRARMRRTAAMFLDQDRVEPALAEE